MMMLFLTLFLIPMFAVMIFIPYWTRKTESFGISIPEEIYDREDLKEMRKKYSIQMTIFSIIFVVIFLLLYFIISKDDLVITITYGVMTLLYMIGSFLVYLSFHRQMKQKKQVENWTEKKAEHLLVSTEFHEQKTTISNLFYIIPLLITLATVVVTFLYYDQIPDRIPMHYDMSGEVTRWETKSYGNVLILPFVQLFLVLTFFIVNIVIAKSKQQISAQDPDVSMHKNIIFRRRWSIFMFVSSIAFTLMFGAIHVSEFLMQMHSNMTTYLPIGISFLIVVGAIILSITTGQGGSRISLPSDTDEHVIERDDDEHWKLGQFYFNRDDPTLFIEKRFGVGWTINFGRPVAWISLIAIILIPLLIPLFIKLF